MENQTLVELNSLLLSIGEWMGFLTQEGSL